MTISTHQIHNVLRAYGKQLGQNRRLPRNTGAANPVQADRISISAQARRQAVIDKITSDVINRIINGGSSDQIEQEVLRQLENEYGGSLSINREDSELVFKVIDKEKREVTKTLSLEDSKFLQDRLEKITKDKINKQMIT